MEKLPNHQPHVYPLTQPIDFIAISFGYVATMLGLRWYMRDKKPVQCETALRLYNIVQIVLNAFMIYGLFWTDIRNFFKINEPYTEKLDYFIYIHFLSKIFDYLDTLFIVLRKKHNQFSFLHLYHHWSVLIIWGITFLVARKHNQITINGSYTLLGLMNSIIHFLMYSHYLITSYGIRNPWKNWLTKAQIIQFYLGIMRVGLCFFFEKLNPKEFLIIDTIYLSSLIVLFSRFYKDSYSVKKDV